MLTLFVRHLAENGDQMYLRELPEPVFKFPLQDRIQHTEDIGMAPFAYAAAVNEHCILIYDVDEHVANDFSVL